MLLRHKYVTPHLCCHTCVFPPPAMTGDVVMVRAHSPDSVGTGTRRQAERMRAGGHVVAHRGSSGLTHAK